jgi:O-antigen ligase
MTKRELSTSDAIIFLSIIYIASSAAPALYLPPAVLGILIALWLIFISSNINFLFYENNITIPPYLPPLITLITYLTVNSLITGLNISDLLSYDAIRYDANIFYSIAPLFLIIFGTIKIADIDRSMNFISIFSALLYTTSETFDFTIFESHNAAGGYFMIQLAYHIGRTKKFEINARLASITLLVIALIMSDSRGSILAIAAGLTSFRLYKFHKTIFKTAFILGIIAIITGLTLAYASWKGMGEIYLYDYSDFGATTEEIQLDTTGFGERPGTFTHRILFLYPMAIDMFIKSPLIGIGFTRFDDYPQQIGADLLINLNTTEAIQHSNFHAHNSYLHFLAETGIVGFALLLNFIKSIFNSFNTDDETGSPAILIMAALLFASLSEHRLTTPSQAAPAFILIALLWLAKSHKSNSITISRSYDK